MATEQRDDVLWQTARDVTKRTDCWISRGGEDAVAGAVYDALARIRVEAAEQREAKIIAWLCRETLDDKPDPYACYYADAIERGEHLK